MDDGTYCVVGRSMQFNNARFEDHYICTNTDGNTVLEGTEAYIIGAEAVVGYRKFYTYPNGVQTLTINAEYGLDQNGNFTCNNNDCNTERTSVIILRNDFKALLNLANITEYELVS